MPWYFDNRENFCISRRAWKIVKNSWIPLVWENSWIFAKPPRNEFLARSAKFHTDDASVPRSGQCFWLDEANYQPIKSTTYIWVVTSHQYGISALIPQTSFCGQACGGVKKNFFSIIMMQDQGKVVQFYSCSFSFQCFPVRFPSKHSDDLDDYMDTTCIQWLTIARIARGLFYMIVSTAEHIIKYPSR